jgi:alkylation response protein AidB-like acyl-CoA dehydrogenase
MTETADEFRQRVRDFIERKAPYVETKAGTRSPHDEENADILRRWSASLYEEGFVGTEWPAEFGGQPDAPPQAPLIVMEELARARAPVPIGAGSLAAHAILTFGTPEQQRRFLPAIRSFEDVWCQLFSEPDAGSDLASMRTRADRDGDVFVINGQKVWSTNAKFAHYGYLLARTNPDVPKHKGITAFALDMRLPGIQVRPLREMPGTSDFNEVFFDNVRLPAENVIGAVDDGWRVAMVSLAEERTGVGALVVRLRMDFDDLVEMARHTQLDGRAASEDPVVRQELARLAARVWAASWNVQASAERARAGRERAADVPLAKLAFAVVNEQMSTFAVDLQGAAGTLATEEPSAHEGGRWQDMFLYAKAYTISGGSNEIMRNLLSERGLGLPRA